MQQRILHFPILLILSFCLFSCTGSRQLVKKSYAFYYETIQGASPKGPGKKEILSAQLDSLNSEVKDLLLDLPVRADTGIVVYIETSTSQVLWDTAWQNGYPFVITTLPVISIPFQAGFIRGGNQVIISPAKGNFLFQLQLYQNKKEITSKSKITNNRIILKGRYKQNTIKYKTSKLVEIVPMPLL